MPDQELDTWICQALKLPKMELDSDTLFSIIKYFFPAADFCADEKTIKEVGAAYIRLLNSDNARDLILIEEPNIKKVNRALYIVVIAIAKTVEQGKDTIEVLKFL
jgi:hypothetical protein